MMCPICRKEAVVRYSPFCSPRCADVDLGRWFGESYVIPTKVEEGTEAGIQVDDNSGEKH